MQRFQVRPAGVMGAAVSGALRRLAVCLCFLVFLLYLSLSGRLGLPLPPLLTGPGAGALANGLLQLVLTLPVCWLCRDVLTDGASQLLHRRPGPDTLAALGALVSLAGGLVGLVMIGIGLASGDGAMTLRWQVDLCFDWAGLILTLAAAGKLPAARLHQQTRRCLDRLEQLVPDSATVVQQGKAVRVELSRVKPGDIVLVRPGTVIPADGLVLEGRVKVDLSALTGDSAPVDRVPGDTVCAGARCLDGPLACQVTRVGEDATPARIARIARQAVQSPSARTRSVDRILSAAVPLVAAAGAVTLAVWLILGQTFPFALARAVSVLVICCPAALDLAVRAPLLAGQADALRQGLLFRSADSLETAGALHTVLLEKTGAVTAGEPSVVDVVGTRKVPAKFLLGLAAGLLAGSDHPLSRAVLKKADADGIRYRPAADFSSVPGRGLLGKVAGKVMAGGSREFLATQCDLPDDLIQAGQQLENRGATPLYFALDRHAAGVIGVADVVRPSSRAAVARLRQLGLRVLLITPDSRESSLPIAAMVGLEPDSLQADLTADQFRQLLRRMQARGPVAMAGEVLQNGEALHQADLGIALGTGDSLTRDTAGLVLLRGDLQGIAAAVELSRRVEARRRQNLRGIWVYHGIALLLAAGVLAGLHLLLSPMVAALLAALSAAAVTANTLRLEGLRPQNTPDDQEARGGNAGEDA